MGTTKYSRQREAIIHFLKSRKDHPTAEVIYQHLKEEQPNLSLGTVYRNLTKLSTNGSILKISCNDTSDHFDGDTSPHAHFICSQCHCITDLSMQSVHLDDILKKENDFNGIVTGSQLLFYGICGHCLAAGEAGQNK